MKSLPLSQARILYPSLKALVSLGIRTDVYLSKIGLPPELLRMNNAPISKFQHFWQFFNVIEAYEGIETTGFLVGMELDLDDLGPGGYFPRRQSSLYQALNSFSYYLPRQVQGTRLEVDVGEETSMLRYTRVESKFCRGADQLAMKCLTAIVDSAEIDDWVPNQVTLIGGESSQLDQILTSKGCEFIEYDAQYTGFSIPTRLLSSPMKALSHKKCRDLEFHSLIDVESVSKKLEEVCAALLDGGYVVTAAESASMIGVSRTTLYRMLNMEGTSYAKILEKVRYKKARDLLDRKRHSIKEVAHLLGYNNLSAFSRSFKNLAGVSPSAYVEMFKD